MLVLNACRPHPEAPGLPLHLAWDSAGEAAKDAYGYRCAWAGDVNGDGNDDFLVAAPGRDGDKGRLYLYYGSPKGLPETPGWMADGEHAGDNFSKSMGGAGDLNGDGFDDIYVASPGYSQLIRGQGAVYVYYGGPPGPSKTPDWAKNGKRVDGSYGDGSAAIGDINGDGYADLLIGTGGEKGPGRVEVYLGGPRGLSKEPSGIMNAKRLDNAGVGDVNGDGYDDRLVGLPGDPASPGRAKLFLGGSQGFSTAAAWEQPGSPAPAGDINGDGAADVLIGAAGEDGGRGHAYLYLGQGPMDGLAHPHQWTADRQHLIGPMGPSGASDAVMLSLELGARATAGWIRGSLEAELKPVGRAFDGQGTQRSVMSPLAPGSQALTIQVKGLHAATGYRWRLRAIGTKTMEPKGDTLATAWLRPAFGSLGGGAYFRTVK